MKIDEARELLRLDEIGIRHSIAKDNLAAAQAEIDQKLEGRAKLFLTLYDWQFSQNPSYLRLGCLRKLTTSLTRTCYQTQIILPL